MKKNIAMLLAITILISTALVGCSSKGSSDETTVDSDGLLANENEYVIEYENVTDKNGEVITDANGVTLTTEVIKKADKDSAAKTTTSAKDAAAKTTVTTSAAKKTTTAKTTTLKQEEEGTTEKEWTTLKPSEDVVPKTSDSGKKVSFSAADQQVVKQMLEAPHLYDASYENADGVPTTIASRAAMWMADRENFNTNVFASGTIVLDLFKFYGQTVVNYKTKCNDATKSTGVTYNKSSDTFTIDFAKNTSAQKVTLTRIEKLGSNNYYKVVGKVSGAGSISKVTAVVQRNKLDSSLGFSIKALKWE